MKISKYGVDGWVTLAEWSGWNSYAPIKRVVGLGLVGRHVRVRGSTLRRVIESVYPDCPGGVRLNKHVKGFVSWSVCDLIFLRKKPTAARPGSRDGGA